MSISSLTSSFSSLSLSSQLSQKSDTLLLPLTTNRSRSQHLTFRVSAAVSSPPEPLKELVKSRLPGGFAAQTIIGTGRRKCSIARVVLQEGTGQVIINYRDAKYVKVPLVTLGYESSYDVFVKAHGGGLSGQAQAISLGVARALLKVSDSHRPPLKQEGLLTRDSRIVERKKAGLKKARKAPQFSKR
ncbi:30S ribosomal protein S9, chloroplastic [Linum perenne]